MDTCYDPNDPFLNKAHNINNSAMLNDYYAKNSRPADAQVDFAPAVASAAERVPLSYVNEDFLRDVAENKLFLKHCENNIALARNWGRKPPTIQKIMSFSKDDLAEPLTRGCKDYASHAVLVFKSLLKLSGARNSRFPANFHIENILNMCVGQHSKLN